MAEVRFIRRHGKIIPIRKKKGDKSKKKKKGGAKKQAALGAATAASGIGVGIAGGKTARKASQLSKRAGQKAGQASKASFKASQRATSGKQLDLFRTLSSGERAKKLASKSSKLRKAAVGFEKVATRSKLFTLAIGGSLIGAGIENIIDASDRNKKVGREVAKDFSVNLASGLIAGAFILGANKAGVRKGSKQAFQVVRDRIKRKKQLGFKL